MGTYVIAIAVTTVLSAVINMLTPEKWSKYIGAVTGLAVTICIASPIISITKSDMFEEFTFTPQKTEAKGNEIYSQEVKKELEQRINEDAKKRIKSEFDADCSVTTEVRISDNFADAEVLSMYITGDKIHAAVIGRLREVYGAENVKYVGDKKTAEKSE